MSWTSPSNAAMHPSRCLRPPLGAFHRWRWCRTDRCLAQFMTAKYTLLGASWWTATSGHVESHLSAPTQAA